MCLCRLAVAVLAATSLTVSVHSILLVWARKTSSYIHNPLQDQKYHCLNLITAYQETCYWNLLSLQLSGFGSDIWILLFFLHLASLKAHLPFCENEWNLEEMRWFRKHCAVLQSCQTLYNPMDYSLPGSTVHGILQARNVSQ